MFPLNRVSARLERRCPEDMLKAVSRKFTIQYVDASCTSSTVLGNLIGESGCAPIKCSLQYSTTVQQYK